MDNQCNRDIDQRMQEIIKLQQTSAIQLTQDQNLETTYNIGSSIMRALDFSVEIDDDDLFPAEDLRYTKKQRSGSKLRSARLGVVNIFDNNRKSNPGAGNFL